MSLCETAANLTYRDSVCDTCKYSNICGLNPQSSDISVCGCYELAEGVDVGGEE